MKPLSNQSGGSPSKLVGATWAISIAVVLVTLGGFGMMFGLVMALISQGVNLSGGGLVLIGFALLIILAIASLLVRQLSRVLDVAQPSGSAAQPQQSKQPTLSEKPVPQISAPRQPVSSVTDHTTQMFEPIQKDRDTQR